MISFEMIHLHIFKPLIIHQSKIVEAELYWQVVYTSKAKMKKTFDQTIREGIW